MRDTITFALAALIAGLHTIGCSGVPKNRLTDDLPSGFFFKDVADNDDSMRAVIYRPRSVDPDALLPTILFLHGYGECGTDGSRHLTVGLPAAIMRHPEHWPFVVVMPQKPRFNVEWEDYEFEVLALIDIAAERYGADPERVVITGLSQGGHGTIAIASRHPDRFLGAAPVCGYISRWNIAEVKERVVTKADSEQLAQAADALARLPVRIYHGGRDDIVPIRESRLLRDALEERGADVVLTEYPDAKHNSWDEAYGKSGLWEWIADITRDHRTPDP